METRELKEILKKKYGANIHHTNAHLQSVSVSDLLEVMQEVSKQSFNDAIRLASDDVETTCKIEDDNICRSLYPSDEAMRVITKNILKLLKP